MVLQRKHCPKTYKVDIRASYPTQLLTFQINTHLKADVNNKFLWAYQPTICQVFKTLCLTKAFVLQGGCMFHNLQAKKKKKSKFGRSPKLPWRPQKIVKSGTPPIKPQKCDKHQKMFPCKCSKLARISVKNVLCVLSLISGGFDIPYGRQGESFCILETPK